MSQLIHIKQKIKTTELIAKVTHAMRLIAMSHHTKLKHIGQLTKTYTHKLTEIFSKGLAQNSSWSHPLFEKKSSKAPELVIIIGSQKGLCGSFNKTLMQKTIGFIQAHTSTSIISIGKEAHTLLTNHYGLTAQLNFPLFNRHLTQQIAQEIVNFILSHSSVYKKFHIFNMKSKGFFKQVVCQTEIIKLFFSLTNSLPEETIAIEGSTIKETLDNLLEQVLLATLVMRMHDSLIAEQAARFLSMDNSTRNAQAILEKIKLYYNKLRQTKITTQLIELVTLANH